MNQERWQSVIPLPMRHPDEELLDGGRKKVMIQCVKIWMTTTRGAQGEQVVGQKKTSKKRSAPSSSSTITATVSARNSEEDGDDTRFYTLATFHIPRIDDSAKGTLTTRGGDTDGNEVMFLVGCLPSKLVFVHFVEIKVDVAINCEEEGGQWLGGRAFHCQVDLFLVGKEEKALVTETIFEKMESCSSIEIPLSGAVPEADKAEESESVNDDNYNDYGREYKERIEKERMRLRVEQSRIDAITDPKQRLVENRKRYKCRGGYVTLEDLQRWDHEVKQLSQLPRHTKKTASSYDAEVEIDEAEDCTKRFPVDTSLNKLISLYQGDITRLEIDGIVNAANSSLLGGGGIDGAIHSAAGDLLDEECEGLNGARTGETKITRGYTLPAKFVLHTVGPMGRGDDKLASCYQTALALVKKHKLRTVAFCCVSTGIFGFPLIRATHIALTTIRTWLESDPTHKTLVDRIIFCTFRDIEMEVYERVLPSYFPMEGFPAKDHTSYTSVETTKAAKVGEKRKRVADEEIGDATWKTKLKADWLTGKWVQSPQDADRLDLPNTTNGSELIKNRGAEVCHIPGSPFNKGWLFHFVEQFVKGLHNYLQSHFQLSNEDEIQLMIVQVNKGGGAIGEKDKTIYFSSNYEKIQQWHIDQAVQDWGLMKQYQVKHIKVVNTGQAGRHAEQKLIEYWDQCTRLNPSLKSNGTRAVIIGERLPCVTCKVAALDYEDIASMCPSHGHFYLSTLNFCPSGVSDLLKAEGAGAQVAAALLAGHRVATV